MNNIVTETVKEINRFISFICARFIYDFLMPSYFYDGKTYVHKSSGNVLIKCKLQACIPVGCVPSAAVAVSSGVGGRVSTQGDVCPGGFCINSALHNVYFSTSDMVQQVSCQ